MSDKCFTDTAGYPVDVLDELCAEQKHVEALGDLCTGALLAAAVEEIERLRGAAQTLPDDIRVPLHELQADVDYLIGRVIADSGCGAMIAASIKDNLAKIEAGIIGIAQAAAKPEPTAWRVWWVSLNTSRTELFEDHAKAAAKAKDVGGCVIPLFNMPAHAQSAALAPEQDK